MVRIVPNLALLFLGVASVSPMTQRDDWNGLFQNSEVIKRHASKSRMPFIVNQGQVDERVQFYVPTFGGSVHVTTCGKIVYCLPARGDRAGNCASPVSISDRPACSDGLTAANLTLVETFPGGSTERISGVDPAATRVSYFTGPERSGWRSGIPTYHAITFGEVYDGIELQLEARGNSVEKLFRVGPGADPEDIRVRVSGATSLRVNEFGELEVLTELGSVSFSRPIAYQEFSGPKERKYVEVAYLIDKNEYSFRVGEFDHRKPLIIDPLLASTYLGGSGTDLSFPRVAIAVDDSAHVYLTGYTRSSHFHPDAGAAEGSLVAGDEAFVAKLNSDLSELLALAILAGDDKDRASSVAFDHSGHIFVAGHTESEDFPYTAAAYDTLYNGTGTCPYGNGDVFVAKFDSDLEVLQAATFLGGSGADYSHCMTLDEAGNVYVSGSTGSGDFPLTPGAADSTHSPGGTFGLDAFVSRLDSNLQTLTASTFLGGSTDDYSEAIVVNGNGDVYVGGWTASGDFPSIPGCYMTSYCGGYYDCFVSKLGSDLSVLTASTFLGGTLWDFVYGLCLDPAGNVFVTGHTASKYNFPYTSNAYDTLYNGGTGQGTTDDSFVSKFDSELTELTASTFLGGVGWETGITITCDENGHVYVANHTNSTGFPVSPFTYDSDYNGGQHDVAVSIFANDLTALVFSTFLGGDGRDYYPGLALDTSRNIYVAGVTGSLLFPYTSGAYDTVYSGRWDVFVSAIPYGYFTDSDGDGLVDLDDNCPGVPNPGQEDADADSVGDSCDVCNGFDDKADEDRDSIPDACDECTDTDGDGYGNPGFPDNTCEMDNCPDDYNPGQEDNDGDGIGNACCCVNISGNIDGDPGEIIDIGDVTVLLDYLYIRPGVEPPDCPPEANIDGDPGGVIDIGDVTALLDYLYIRPGVEPPAECP